MSDFKKLFKRDRFYWVGVAVIMTLFLIYWMSKISVYGAYHKLFNKADALEKLQSFYAFQETHPNSPSNFPVSDIPFFYVDFMVNWTVIVALVAQAARLLAQETRNRAEALRTFPVKSRNIVTWHHLSGLLTVGIPLLIQTAILRLDIWYVERNTDLLFKNKEQLWSYAGKGIVLFMMLSSLLILCRKITTDVPGTIFTFIVVEFAMIVLEYYLNLYDAKIPNWIFQAITAAVWILLSYVADQKQDLARNGTFSFTIVHWLIMGGIFGSIHFLFFDFFDALSQFATAVSFLLSVAISLLMTAIVHLITRPKKI